nr:MAK10-like protein [Tanacetum cinerariifolium]
MQSYVSILSLRMNENLIRTLEDYSKPSHEGYRNTIELPEENNVVPLRSDTIRMDSFQGLTLKFPRHGINLWLHQIFYDHVNPATRRTIDQSAGEELNNNPSSLKRVHFIISIVIINKESKVKEERSMRCNGAKSNDHKRMVKAKEEVGDESENELEEETEEESEKEKEDNLEYFNTFPTMEELRYHE